MTLKKKILFIINPISGVGKKNTIPGLITRCLDADRFSAEIVYTRYRRHGHEIALAEKHTCDAIVAVGGDGSVNEIGSALVGSSCALAIIPAGSGNGLARHARIPLHHEAAIRRINAFRPIAIDTGTVNGHAFLGTCGFGFDAHIAKRFDEFHKRGFFSYVRLVTREFRRYSPCRFRVSVDGKQFDRTALLCSVANSSQFGNGFSISPLSDFRDGRFELVFLRRFNPAYLPALATRFFTRRIHRSRYFESVCFERPITITTPDGPVYFHIDGEPVDRADRFEVRILPESLLLL